MARWEIHRTDANAPAIIAAIRKLGASVEIIDRPVDLVVGVQRLTALAEIKTSKGKLRASQRAFLRDWRGFCVVLRTVDDGIRLVEELRWMASVLQRVGWPEETKEEASLGSRLVNVFGPRPFRE